VEALVPALDRISAQESVPGKRSSRCAPREDQTKRLVQETLESSLSGLRQRRVLVRKLHRLDFADTESFHSERWCGLLEGGESVRVFLKDLNPKHQTHLARKVRDADLTPSYREVEVYSSILAPLRLGTPEFYGERWDAERGIYWLLLEDVGSSRLRESRNFARWLPAAEWAARFHAATRVLAKSVTKFLPRHGRLRFLNCAARITKILPRLQNGDRKIIEPAVRRLGSSVDRLTAFPQSVVHGQYFGRNIMLRLRRPKQLIAPIDWETAMVGPSWYDLVSLTAGHWTREQRLALWRAYFDAYRAETRSDLGWNSFCNCLREVEIYQALEWLSWWRSRSVSHNFGTWMKELERIMKDDPDMA